MSTAFPGLYTVFLTIGSPIKGYKLSNTGFQPTGLGARIFQERYARSPDESWQEACERLAQTMASAEDNGNVERFTKRFSSELRDGFFMPGGRIWANAGRPSQQLLNCFVVPVSDSKEGWFQGLYDMGVISATGGGVGVNFSPVRGRGYPIAGNGGVSTGAVSLMQMFDRVGDVLVSGGGRRLALMLCLNVDHPDIEEFLNVKLDLHELNNANISVSLPDHISTEEFQRIVREDGEIELKFGGLPDKMGRKIRARDFWNRLVENAWQSGEPGVLNGHLANKMNTMFYKWPLISTNPCGEIWLPAFGCCDLGAMVLPRFVEDGEFNWEKLDESIRLGVRFLDNVLSVNDYPLPAIRAVCQEERRIGLGVMGLHSMLLDLGMHYSSERSFDFVDKLFGFIKNTAYDASITLAAEKGSFPAYDPQFLNSGFAKTLKRGIRSKIREYGIRNCALLTIAPTGTTSMVHAVTGGLEPLFSPLYIRRRKKVDNMAREYKERTLVVSKEFLDHGDMVEGAYDISPADHIRMQITVQTHIDNAVSKTINLAEDFPVEELSELWLENLASMKGSTFYRQGSRGEEPMEHVPVELLDSTLAEWTEEIEYEDAESMECPGGACEIRLPGVLSEVGGD